MTGVQTCALPISRACYDEAKRYCETLAYIFNKKFKTKISIVRPFNNFGPGMNISDLRLPSDMAKSILNKKKIFLFSNGSPKRSFCYIADAVVGYLEALSYKKFEIFNIGNTKEMSVLQFAKLPNKRSFTNCKKKSCKLYAAAQASLLMLTVALSKCRVLFTSHSHAEFLLLI